MSEFTQWIISHGVSQDILEMMIFVPALATLVSLARYVLGLKTFGIYAPIVLSISYMFTGLRYGLLLTFIVFLSTLIGYSAMKRIRMHYITRISINYVIISIFIVLGIALFTWLPLGFENFYLINPLAIVAIASLSDFFIKMYVKKSISATVRTFTETILVSIIGWYVITSRELIELLVQNLWIVPVLVIINILIGQYKGLRFKDIFRFKSVVENAD